jgi:phosphinothricin acetyltransferase
MNWCRSEIVKRSRKEWWRPSGYSHATRLLAGPKRRDEIDESEAIDLPGIQIRAATRDDLPRLTEIYNHYVLHTPVTFDIAPWAIEQRIPWFEQFDKTGRYRLLVAEKDSLVVGYAGTTRFRPKAAYDTTVETTIYCAPESIGKGLGTQLYAALFATLSGENIHRIVAGYVPPNPISAALHERFGFKAVGVFSENGYKFNRYWDVCWMERPLKTL